MTEEQLPQQSIVQRIRAVGLEVHTVLEAPPKRWPKYAREIVGAEYHVSPSVILKQIRQAQTR
jgi:hypothetical protein